MKKRTLLLCLCTTFMLPACGQSDADGEESGTAEGGTGDTADSAEGTGGSDDGEMMPTGVPILGDGTHDVDNLEVVLVAGPADGLNQPTDLEFNPDQEGALWVTNIADFSMVVIGDAGKSTQGTVKVRDEFEGGQHFLAKPAALAFGTNGAFATAQQEDGYTQPDTPFDFMGPTLWTSDFYDFTGGHWGHLDMLHNSPLSSGIAWAGGNAYWIYDGAHRSLTFYDFVADHGLGGTDHSDGVVYRFVEGEVGYQGGQVPHHVEYDMGSGFVYAADAANGRIVRLDSNTGTMGSFIGPDYDGGTQRRWDGAVLETLIEGSTLDPLMKMPSGITLHDGMIFVSDHELSRLYAFSMSGQLLDWVDMGLPAGSLVGFTFADDGSLYFADKLGSRVFRINAP